jgi:hypothetical protein
VVVEDLDSAALEGVRDAQLVAVVVELHGGLDEIAHVFERRLSGEAARSVARGSRIQNPRSRLSLKFGLCVLPA